MRNWLFSGVVLHRRLRPVVNAFRYPVFFLRFPLSRIDELSNLVFSINRFNLLSFHFADHGDGRAPAVWIRELLAAANRFANARRRLHQLHNRLTLRLHRVERLRSERELNSRLKCALLGGKNILNGVTTSTGGTHELVSQ